MFKTEPRMRNIHGVVQSIIRPTFYRHCSSVVPRRPPSNDMRRTLLTGDITERSWWSPSWENVLDPAMEDRINPGSAGRNGLWVHGNDLLREMVHQENPLLPVRVEFVDEAEPVDHQSWTKPATNKQSMVSRPANRPAFGGTVPLFYQMSRVPINHGNVPVFVRSRILSPN